MRAIGLHWVAAIVAAFSLSLPLFAEDKPSSDAERLFREGRAAMKQQDYATACSKFVDSLGLQPTAGTLLNLSECSEKQGKLVEALRYQREAIGKLPADDERVPDAKEREASLDKRVPRITLKLSANAKLDTTVTLDGSAITSAKLGDAIPINPGKHVVKVSGADGRENVKQLSLKESDRTEVVLEPPALGEPVDSGGTTSNETGFTMRTWGYVVGGVGVAGLGIGTYFAFHASSLNSQATTYDHFHPNGNSENYSTGFYCDAFCHDQTNASISAWKIAYGSLIGGGALVASGLVMVLMPPSAKSEYNSSAVSLRAVAGPGAVGLRVGGGW